VSSRGLGRSLDDRDQARQRKRLGDDLEYIERTCLLLGGLVVEACHQHARERRPRRAEEPPGEQLALSALCAAAAAGHGLAGERAGEPLLRIVDPARARKNERVGESGGINVHAEVAVPPRDRARLERLCRYVCRPPIAQEQLEETANGKLRSP